MPRDQNPIWELNLFYLPVYNPVTKRFVDPAEKIPTTNLTYCLGCLDLAIADEILVDEEKVRLQLLSPDARRSRQQITLECKSNLIIKPPFRMIIWS
jgi:hypothetical protein